jgi:hypothetical protein
MKRVKQPTDSTHVVRYATTIADVRLYGDKAKALKMIEDIPVFLAKYPNASQFSLKKLNLEKERSMRFFKDLSKRKTPRN